jgi:hypothetical protein
MKVSRRKGSLGRALSFLPVLARVATDGGMQVSRHPKIPEGSFFPLWRGLVSECREINEPLTASARMVPGGRHLMV